MPELPDVETFRRYVGATALHQHIERAELRDKAILAGTGGAAIARRLKGHAFERTYRHGKYLFIRIGGNGWLVLHFGMTGFLRYAKADEEDPKHDHFVVHFKNGYHLAFNNRRKLGRVGLTDKPEDLIAGKSLGPDALSINKRDFDELLASGSGTVKGRLTDQARIAGLGNVYADEVLFHAGVHPKTALNDIDKRKRTGIFNAMRKVLQKTIACRADVGRYPRSYLTPHRHDGGACPRCRVPLKRTKVSGRTTYYCPRHQPLNRG